MFLHLWQIFFQAVTNANQFWDFMVKVCDHLPFLAATSFFRISAITLCLTYINIWAILPIALYWISNLFVGYRKYVTAKSATSASILNIQFKNNYTSMN